MTPLTLDDYHRAGRALVERVRADVLGAGPVAVYSKHRLGSLTPGFSDLDLRLVLAKPRAAAEEWLALSRALGEAYLALLTDAPHFARILEHPPGALYTPGEAVALLLLAGEVRDWERLAGEPTALEPAQAAQAAQWAGPTPWQRQEAIAKYGSYLVPREEQVDPPINLLPDLLPYYPVYGALAHWLLPAGKLAAGVLEDAWVPTKPAALPALRRLLGELPSLAQAEAIFARRYRVVLPPADWRALTADWLRLLRDLEARVVVAGGLGTAAGITAGAEGGGHAAGSGEPAAARGRLQIAGGIRGRFGILHYFRHAPPSFDATFLRSNLCDELRFLTSGLLAAIAGPRDPDPAAGSPEASCRPELSPGDAAAVEAVERALGFSGVVTDRHLDRLLDVWPAFARTAEGLLADLTERFT